MSYETDFYGWVQHQAALLRAGRAGEADAANIAEELESMGRREKRELISRLAVLLAHLLKWHHQPDRRSRSWQGTIKVQRRDLARHLRDNPSLKALIGEVVADAYGDAIVTASVETGLPESAFLPTCPWPWEAILDQDFLP